jgi:hypothetical protein
MSESPKIAELRALVHQIAGLEPGDARNHAMASRAELMALLVRGYPDSFVESAGRIHPLQRAAIEAEIPQATVAVAAAMAASIASDPPPRGSYNAALYFDFATGDSRDLVPVVIFGDSRKLAYVRAHGGDADAARFDPWNPAPDEWAPPDETHQPATLMYRTGRSPAGAVSRRPDQRHQRKTQTSPAA